MFKTRLISGIILLAVAMTVILLGDNVLLVLFSHILIGMTELYKIMKIEKSIIGIIGYLVSIAYYGLLYF